MSNLERELRNELGNNFEKAYKELFDDLLSRTGRRHPRENVLIYMRQMEDFMKYGTPPSIFF